jgi:hypothetical protein
VAEVSVVQSRKDIFGRWKARWGIGRMNYTVPPGLYSLGKQETGSPVFVTANYKMTFDLLKKELGGLDAWILVLNTRGINVWCAAGKGTFGTDELVHRIKKVRLAQRIKNRTLILPQLGAPGVAAHEVKKRTGFRVVYGPVYSRDIRRFMERGMKATPDMRKVRFGLKERLPLIPMEIIPAMKFIPWILGFLVVFRLVDGTGIHADIWKDILPYLGALFLGGVVFQILLPLIPGRSFAFKGWLLGLVWAIFSNELLRLNTWTSISNICILPMMVGFIALNFTGATTFTSLSGVQKEMKFAVPLMIVSAFAGMIIRIIPAFVS